MTSTSRFVPVERFPSGPAEEYKTARARIRSGDLLLCSGSYPFSRLLRLATESRWSHVALLLRLDPPLDRVMVLESVETYGVRTIALSKYVGDFDNRGNPYSGGIVVARHRRFAEEPRDLRELTLRAIEGFGRSYGTEHMAQIAGRILASRLESEEAKKVLDQFELEELRGGAKGFICSEYVHDCYAKIGIEIQGDARGFVTPADFVRGDQLELIAVIQRPPPSKGATE
jgi:hypothetical protein